MRPFTGVNEGSFDNQVMWTLSLAPAGEKENGPGRTSPSSSRIQSSAIFTSPSARAGGMAVGAGAYGATQGHSAGTGTAYTPDPAGFTSGERIETSALPVLTRLTN